MMISQCAWCGAIKTHNDEYVSPSIRLPLLTNITMTDMDGSEMIYHVSHGICPHCRDEMLAEYETYRTERIA